MSAKIARYTAIEGNSGVTMAKNVSNYEKSNKAPQNGYNARGQV
jgi:hypothetical protein